MNWLSIRTCIQISTWTFFGGLCSVYNFDADFYLNLDLNLVLYLDLDLDSDLDFASDLVWDVGLDFDLS